MTLELSSVSWESFNISGFFVENFRILTAGNLVNTQGVVEILERYGKKTATEGVLCSKNAPRRQNKYTNLTKQNPARLWPSSSQADRSGSFKEVDAMAGQRQPIDLIVAKGKKHISKADIEARRASEVQPCVDQIEAPAYLTAAQKKRFDTLAGQLQKIKIMGETDTETLARYITAQELYEQAVKDLRAVQKQRPKDAELEQVVAWADMLDRLDKRLDRYFKQAHTAATALGLTISSRCKLQVPVAPEDDKPKNKFARFGKAAGGGSL